MPAEQVASRRGAPGTLRRAIADAYHERRCGPIHGLCEPGCEGRMDVEALDAVTAAAKAWADDQARRKLVKALGAVDTAVASLRRQAEAPPEPEPEAVVLPSPCRVCGATPEACEAVLHRTGKPCCSTCRRTDTHQADLASWKAWRDQLHGTPL